MQVSPSRSIALVLVALGAFAACGQGASGDSFDSDGGVSSPSSSGGGHPSSSGSTSSGGSSTSSSSSGGSFGNGSTSSGSGSTSGGSTSSGGGTSSSGATSAEAGTCGSCTSDSDCQSTCPPVQGGGSNCCDVGSDVCYATTQSVCPSPSEAGVD